MKISSQESFNWQPQFLLLGRERGHRRKKPKPENNQYHLRYCGSTLLPALLETTQISEKSDVTLDDTNKTFIYSSIPQIMHRLINLFLSDRLYDKSGLHWFHVSACFCSTNMFHAGQDASNLYSRLWEHAFYVSTHCIFNFLVGLVPKSSNPSFAYDQSLLLI